MAHILIINREQNTNDTIASNALAAMIKSIGHTVEQTTLAQMHNTQPEAAPPNNTQPTSTLPPDTAYVFFYPELANIATIEHLMGINTRTTFIMTTGSTKERSLNPDTEQEKFPNFKVLARPFSVDTLKALLQ